MKEVMKAMLLKKLRVAVGAVMVAVALGAVGLGYQQAGGPGAAQAAPPDKPVSELEALRKEHELLKLNLQVVLEKVRAQEAELQGLRRELAARAPKGKVWWEGAVLDSDGDGWMDVYVADGKLLRSYLDGTSRTVKDLSSPKDDVSAAVKEVEDAAKALREAKDKEGKRRAAEALEKATKKLREQLK
jgi:hypothetical protein